MKSLGQVSILSPGESLTTINDLFAKVLGLTQGTILHAVALHAPSQPPDPEGRLLTLLFTSFPRSSWKRLIRLSTSIDSQPGSLYKLLHKLKSLGVFPRHIEDVTGTGLPMFLYPRNGYGLDRPHPRLVLPGVKLTLELPDQPCGNERQREIQKSLIGLIDQARPTDQAVELLEGALKEVDPKAEIEWISPMATLNRLGETIGLRSEKLGVGGQQVGAGKPTLTLDLQRWLRRYWRGDPFAPDGPGGRVLLLPAVDSDEQVLAYHLFQHTDRLVITFSLMTPAAGMEPAWWRYICECVWRARGTVLGAQSTARTNGFWGSIELTAAFPMDRAEEPERGSAGKPTMSPADRGKKVVPDPTPILNCFRELQGDRSFTDAFRKFQDELINEVSQLGPYLFGNDIDPGWLAHWEKPDASTKSQLERLVVHDPQSVSTGPRFPDVKFGDNPFGFTSPMDRATYLRLYGAEKDASEGRTRLRAAKRIVEKLRRGENVAIVGAHRTGKTTLLNLVFDLLDGPALGQTSAEIGQPPAESIAETINLIPVRINAAVTPPHMFVTEVIYELRRRGEGEGLVALARGVGRELVDLLNNAVDKLTVGIGPIAGGALPQESLDGHDAVGDPVVDRIRRLLAMEPESLVPQYLRLTLGTLRKVIDEVAKNHPGLRLVLLVDEFSESLPWGDSRALAVWRHVIEAPEFACIRWLFSTSRPVADASDYSPLTNSLVELNVGALADEEAHGMIDAFSVRAWNKEQREGHRSDSWWPVITFPARTFLIGITNRLPYLLQVCCYHIYERATRLEFPLINKMLCRRAIVSKVLPEISDYFEVQWRRVSAETAAKVEKSLREFMQGYPPTGDDASEPDRFLQVSGSWTLAPDRLPPGSLKDLERSGLRVEDGQCVAPLVGAWLLSRGSA